MSPHHSRPATMLMQETLALDAGVDALQVRVLLPLLTFHSRRLCSPAPKGSNSEQLRSTVPAIACGPDATLGNSARGWNAIEC